MEKEKVQEMFQTLSGDPGVWVRQHSEAADQVTCKTYFNLMNMGKTLPDLYKSCMNFARASEVASAAGMEFFKNLHKSSSFVQSSSCDAQLINFMMTFTKNLCTVQSMHNELLKSMLVKMSIAEARWEGEYKQTLNDFSEYDQESSQTHEKLYKTGKGATGERSESTQVEDQELLSGRVASMKTALMHEHVMFVDTAQIIKYYIDDYRRFCIDAEPYLIGIYNLKSIVERNSLIKFRNLEGPRSQVIKRYFDSYTPLLQKDQIMNIRLAKIDHSIYNSGLKKLPRGYIEAAKRIDDDSLSNIRKWDRRDQKNKYDYDSNKVRRDIEMYIDEDFSSEMQTEMYDKTAECYNLGPVSDQTIKEVFYEVFPPGYESELDRATVIQQQAYVPPVQPVYVEKTVIITQSPPVYEAPAPVQRQESIQHVKSVQSIQPVITELALPASTDNRSEEASEQTGKKGGKFWSKLFGNKKGKGSKATSTETLERKQSVAAQPEPITKTESSTQILNTSDASAMTSEETPEASDLEKHKKIVQRTMSEASLAGSGTVRKTKQSTIKKMASAKSSDGISSQNIRELCGPADIRMYRITVNREASKEWFDLIGVDGGLPFVTPTLFNEVPLKYATELIC